MVGLSLASGGERASAAPPRIVAKQVETFSSPVFVANAPGRASRNLLFVVEREGKIRVVRDGRALSKPFLNISGEVTDDFGEQGLLSVAFDPGYAKNRRFYVYYTDANENIRISSFQRSKTDPAQALKGSERRVIVVPHPQFPNHNGGTAMFGPDGNLWIGTGDGGAGCDPNENAQNKSSLLGKLLRIDPKPDGGYSTPAGNPYAGAIPGNDAIYSIGLRNPFRFSFDPRNGNLAIGDVGQNRFEEIDYETQAGAKGANFGWDAREGPIRLPAGECGASDPQTPEPASRQDPIHFYAHDGGGHTGCAVIGGIVVRDRDLPSLRGRYLYSDACNGSIWSLIPRLTGAGDDRRTGASVPQPTSFGTDRQGHVYVTALAGGLYRLREAGVATASASPARSSSGEDPAALTERAGDGKGGYRSKGIAKFKAPTYVTGPKGANGLVFVVEQRGVIRLLKGGHKLGGSFLDIRDKVRSGGEQGLLSVAFPRDYAKSHRFYVYFTDAKNRIRVQEYKRSRKSPRKAIEKSARNVITIRHPGATNHNGGQLQFGPDGLLYLGTGDGGFGGDPSENAQDKGSLLGKILRINPRRQGKRGYGIPRSNPYVGKGGRDEIFARGLRNPYRFSFDGRHIAIGDVGQDAWEEVDYETLKSARGANFGWDAFEGSHRYQGDASPRPKKREDPILDYSHGGSNCAITGGFVSRDRKIPSLRGRYLYADFCGGQVRSLVPGTRGARGDRPTDLPRRAGISSFGEDARGRIWFANLYTGTVYRIVPKG